MIVSSLSFHTKFRKKIFFLPCMLPINPNHHF
jgi:hypothetical protein